MFLRFIFIYFLQPVINQSSIITSLIVLSSKMSACTYFVDNDYVEPLIRNTQYVHYSHVIHSTIIPAAMGSLLDIHAF